MGKPAQEIVERCHAGLEEIHIGGLHGHAGWGGVDLAFEEGSNPGADLIEDGIGSAGQCCGLKRDFGDLIDHGHVRYCLTRADDGL